MTTNNNKTSLLVASQLPEFISNDPAYGNFVLFLEAYYEWLGQQGNSQNLLDYKDVDTTTEEFLNYFQNDFLSYFPTDILADKKQVIKIAKQLYQSKGTPASYKFLFRILYNSDVDFFFTKDAVLKASSGSWYIPISLKLSSNELNFLATKNLRIFGQQTKSIATIETAVLVNNKIEIFISNIQRLFQSGEQVSIVDSNNQLVYFLDGNIVDSTTVGAETLSAQIVGQINKITVNSNFRGLFYEPGDPVIVYGGLATTEGQGATAEIGSVTSGSIQIINTLSSGYGYTASPNTVINITNAPGAIAIVQSLDPAGIANATFIPTDEISLKRFTQIGANNYNFANSSWSNASVSLANAFTFTSLTTYPISSVSVENGGGGITVQPVVSAQSTYETEVPGDLGDLSNFGILAPIQILNGGEGYYANDTIEIINGRGWGAYANITSVSANGAITGVEYVYSSTDTTPEYPLGGMGYKQDGLPAVIVTSANTLAANAVLVVPSILGRGATFSTTVDRVGSIKTIDVTDFGEDYISTPSVSLAVQDILVYGLSPSSLPLRGDIVYQGVDYENASYVATVDRATILTSFFNPLDTIYKLRVFNYNSIPDYTQTLKIATKDIVAIISSQSANVINYGDGTARATASFLNGLSVGTGQYLDTSGQLSSFDVLQSTEYNNYTYQITLEKEIAKYRTTLLNLLHPTGMQVIGRYAMKSNDVLDYNINDALITGHHLNFYTGTENSTANMSADFINQSSNTIYFDNLEGADITTFIFPETSSISLTTSDGFNITSQVKSVDATSNSVILIDNCWLTFANVAYVTANGGSNVINITAVTGSYDIINNGNYTDSNYPLKDILHTGDFVSVNNEIKLITSVDYLNNKIYINSNLSNSANGLLSVTHTLVTNNVHIFGPVGIQYVPQILTEDGRVLITEDENILILG